MNSAITTRRRVSMKARIHHLGNRESNHPAAMAGMQRARGDEARFAIVLQVVRASQVPADKNLHSKLEAEASLNQYGCPFRNSS